MAARDAERTTVAIHITRYEHRALLARAFELRANVTMYDAVYLALAEALEVPLLTADAALGEVPGSTAAVDVRPAV